MIVGYRSVSVTVTFISVYCTHTPFFLTNVRYILLIFALCFVQFWGQIFSVNVSWCNGVLGWSAVVSANVNVTDNHFPALIFIIFFWGRATKSPKCHNTVDVCLWTMMHCFVQYVSYCSYKRFITMKLISTSDCRLNAVSLFCFSTMSTFGPVENKLS